MRVYIEGYVDVEIEDKNLDEQSIMENLKISVEHDDHYVSMFDLEDLRIVE